MSGEFEMSPIRRAGFTLIELVIAMAILGILSAIAIPQYLQYLERGRRAEARGALSQAAQQFERYFSANNTYAAPTLAAAGVSATTSSGKHSISFVANQATFTLTAIPAGWSDSTCGALTLTGAGVQSSASGTLKECWQK